MPTPGPELFEVPFGDHLLRGDRLGPDLPAQVVMLHGAGSHNRGKMRPLRDDLIARGVGSTAFDMIGHGETGGVLLRSSLAERKQQAQAVIETLGLAGPGPLAVMGASMGAHTAVQLTRHLAVDRLVVIVPAMYAATAENVRFDQGFTDIIRRPESWREADGWDLLRRFRGRLLVIAADGDAVIPPEVVRRYHESAVVAAERELYRIEDVGHMAFTELREKDPAEMERVIDCIAAAIHPA